MEIKTTLSPIKRAFSQGDRCGALGRFLGRAFTAIYTVVIRWRFAEFGEGSIVECGCRLERPDCIAVGKNVKIGSGVWLNAEDWRNDGGASLQIGDGTVISRYTHINAFKDVVIESDVLIGEGVYIGDTEHISDDMDRPIIKQGWQFKGPVRLKSGCYIAKGASVLPGVTIGRNAVVGSLSVVTMNVRDGAIVVGNPPRVIRKGK